jgi:hypothetical protein
MLPTPWRSQSVPDPARDYLVMASRLPLLSYRRIPHFLWLTLSVARQLEHTPGLIGYSLLAQPGRKTFWTLSAWTDRAHLGAFVGAMPHLAVMSRLQTHMGATRFTTWTVNGSSLPISWPDAIERLAKTPAKRAVPED